MLTNVLVLVTAYLLGSIPFGYLLVKWVKGVDVRTKGSGNIGMTNVWRVAGAKWGILTLVLDIAKGALAVAIARYFVPDNQLVIVLAGFVALLGNIFSVFLNFKGGKGIGISVGVFFSLLWMPSTAGLIVFFIALAIGRMISVGSLLGVTTMAGLTLYTHGMDWYTALALFATAMIWWTHRQNIKRILSGTENKIGKKKIGKKKKK
jgi:acyl phosphate:glycerol-3-phosphate acyltransferase